MVKQHGKHWNDPRASPEEDLTVFRVGSWMVAFRVSSSTPSIGADKLMEITLKTKRRTHELR